MRKKIETCMERMQNRMKIMTLFVLLILLTACGKKNEDIEAQIKADFFGEGTHIESILSEYVKIRVTKIEGDYVHIELTAPNVVESLNEWCENNVFSEDGFEKALREALSEEVSPKQYQLKILDDGSIVYEEAFCSSIGCGLDEFYFSMQRELILELKEVEGND